MYVQSRLKKLVGHLNSLLTSRYEAVNIALFATIEYFREVSDSRYKRTHDIRLNDINRFIFKYDVIITHCDNILIKVEKSCPSKYKTMPQEISLFTHLTEQSRKTFQSMIRDWRSGNGVSDYIQSVLRKLGSDVHVFDPSAINKRNPFEMICSDVEVNEQIPLAKTFS